MIEWIIKDHEETRKDKGKSVMAVKELFDLLLHISEDECSEIKLTREKTLSISSWYVNLDVLELLSMSHCQLFLFDASIWLLEFPNASKFHDRHFQTCLGFDIYA